MACLYRRINYWWVFYLAYFIKSIIKMKFYLSKLPVISIGIFYIFCLIAAYFYPGSEKEIINFKSENYSFTIVYAKIITIFYKLKIYSML